MIADAVKDSGTLLPSMHSQTQARTSFRRCISEVATTSCDRPSTSRHREDFSWQNTVQGSEFLVKLRKPTTGKRIHRRASWTRSRLMTTGSGHASSGRLEQHHASMQNQALSALLTRRFRGMDPSDRCRSSLGSKLGEWDQVGSSCQRARQ